jgi:2'-5' RNA ligase
MRLFVALDIPEDVRGRLTEFVERLKAKFPDEKWVRTEGLHVTLKFIGESQKVDEIKEVLRAVKSPPLAVTFRGTGFFTNKQPRVFYAGVESSADLKALAECVDEQVAKLGVERESRAYTPHLTLARPGSGDPHASGKKNRWPTMKKLRDYVLAAPELQQAEFGTMQAKEFFLYQSKTGRGGSVYTKLERFPLKV